MVLKKCWMLMDGLSWACINTTASDHVPWGLKNNLSMCGWMWLLLKPESKIKTTNLSLWQLWNLTPQRYLFFIFWGCTEKTTPERFSKYLLSGLCFLPCESLIAMHVILLDRHILPYQLLGERLVLMSVNLEKALFSYWCFLQVYFQESPTVENWWTYWSLLDH